eukprot:m.169231 g.169231  ORF g.169231 m.169231 type:complete len:52 (-) comp31558_c0_seq1:27-182(-)
MIKQTEKAINFHAQTTNHNLNTIQTTRKNVKSNATENKIALSKRSITQSNI